MSEFPHLPGDRNTRPDATITDLQQWRENHTPTWSRLTRLGRNPNGSLAEVVPLRPDDTALPAGRKPWGPPTEVTIAIKRRGGSFDSTGYRFTIPHQPGDASGPSEQPPLPGGW